MKILPARTLPPLHHESSYISILSKAEGFAALLRQNFNYDVLGPEGFKTLAYVTNNSRFYYVEYSDLQDMAALLDEILDGQC